MNGLLSDQATPTSPETRWKRKQVGGDRGPAQLKNTPTATLKPSQYIHIARNITTNTASPPQVPRHIIGALRRCIYHRKVVCSWFARETEDVGIIESNRRHMYFVWVLEQTLELLQPFQGAAVEDKLANDEAAKDQTHVDGPSNIFEGLDVHQTSDGLAEQEQMYDTHNAIPAGTSFEEAVELAEDPCFGEISAKPQQSKYRRRYKTECFLHDVDRFVRQHRRTTLLPNGLSRKKQLFSSSPLSAGIDLNQGTITKTSSSTMHVRGATIRPILRFCRRFSQQHSVPVAWKTAATVPVKIG